MSTVIDQQFELLLNKLTMMHPSVANSFKLNVYRLIGGRTPAVEF